MIRSLVRGLSMVAVFHASIQSAGGGAQSEPRLIHRFELPADNLSKKMLCAVNVGDRGSLFENAVGQLSNSTVKDGFDDYALLLDPPENVTGDAEIWIFDGRTGERYVDPTSPLQKLTYKFDRVCSLGAFAEPAGLCAAGGKHMIGSVEYPDLIVGCPGAGGAQRGEVWVLDMELFAVDPVTKEPDPVVNLRFSSPLGVQNNGQFGTSVEILGHFTGTDESEVLIGEPGRTDSGSPPPDETGRVHYIDLTGGPGGVPSVEASARPPAACYTPFTTDVSIAFGAFTAAFGDVGMDDVMGNPQWGEDGVCDIVVGDPRWSFNAMNELHNGAAAWFNSAKVLAGQRVESMLCATGLGPQNYLGYFVSSAGDRDNFKGSPGRVTASWDFIIPKGTNFFQPISIDGFYMERDGSGGIPPINGIPRIWGWSSGTLFPHYAAIAPAGQGPENWRSNSHARQLSAAGDMNLDAVYEGHDDYAYVKYNEQDAVNGHYYRHEVHVADGGSETIPPATLYALTRDPVADRDLLGVPTNTTYIPGQETPRRTTVYKLGDVDGDGLDDLGVVSGYSTVENYTVGEVPTHGVLLVIGSNHFPAPPPAQAGGTPTLRGNFVAQRGSRIAMRLAGLPANAPVTLYEDTVLMQPGVGEVGCQGTRVVDGNQYNLTADAMGDVFFVLDLDYADPDPLRTTPGTAWYYQARISGYAGPFPCRFSSVKAMHIVDSSQPLDQYEGDS